MNTWFSCALAALRTAEKSTFLMALCAVLLAIADARATAIGLAHGGFETNGIAALAHAAMGGGYWGTLAAKTAMSALALSLSVSHGERRVRLVLAGICAVQAVAMAWNVPQLEKLIQ